MRQHDTRALARLMRTTALGGLVTALAAGAHAWAGGALPHPLILAALLAVTALASVAIGRLPLRLPGLVAVLGGGQFALHEAFTSLASSGSATASAASALALGRHQHSSDAAAALSSLQTGQADSLAAHGHESPAMIALHAAATLVCAVALRKAEAALAALAHWLRPLTRPGRPTAVVLPARPLPVAPRAARRVLTWHQQAPPPLRGPPAAPAFA